MFYSFKGGAHIEIYHMHRYSIANLKPLQFKFKKLWNVPKMVLITDTTVIRILICTQCCFTWNIDSNGYNSIPPPPISQFPTLRPWLGHNGNSISRLYSMQLWLEYWSNRAQGSWHAMSGCLRNNIEQRKLNISVYIYLSLFYTLSLSIRSFLIYQYI